MRKSLSLLSLYGLAMVMLLVVWNPMSVVSAAATNNKDNAAESKIPPHRRHRQNNVKNKPLTESERLQEYAKRNYTWPLSNYNPNTEGWKRLMDARFAQVAEIEDSGPRYEGYIQTMHSAFLVPNFTQHGFGLARCPPELLQDLQTAIHEGLAQNKTRPETKIPVIDAPQQPRMISRPDLTRRVLHELQIYAETWAQGMPLTPYMAYGFRLYQNQSQLYMHVDKMQSHIISFILHIDSSDDAEPWPITIEDFHGQTHQVILTPGDMLFYESSKCWHGRPQRFHGSWYTSVFVHFYPTNDWYDRNHNMEAHYAVPPVWSQSPSSTKQHRALEMKGTSMMEPDCPNQWCRTMFAKKWSGPGEEGYVLNPDGSKTVFEPRAKMEDAASEEEREEL